ncbi:non-ribosomal peptide synthetase [Cohnella panacarvi]|uniref:non-ribosomal peptide synthetase n=1 Tax=Cohnella panacarvi TaxID=400776 RepID=UPI00047A0BFF|nr:non-ribosomal peptide synthetase [Cohnella panacarvi]
MPPRSLDERAFERQAMSFWKTALAGWVNEPFLEPDLIGASRRLRTIEFRIPESITSAMERTCRQRDDLRFIYYVAAMAIVLAAFSRERRTMAVAVPAAPDSAAGPLIPILYGNPREEGTFKSWLTRMFETFKLAYRYADYAWNAPADEHEKTGLKRFRLSDQTWQGRELANSSGESDDNEVWIHFILNEVGDRTAIVRFDEGRYSEPLIRSVMDSFLAVLTQSADNPEIPLASLDMRSSEEKSRQRAWNDTGAFFEQELTIHERFARLAGSQPERLAVMDGTRSLTYGALHERSDELAHRLLGEGISPGDRVAVMLERSAEWAATFLAVLKAGGVYTPIDPSYPTERIAYMLSDSQATALVVSEAPATALDFRGRIVHLAESSPKASPEVNRHPPGMPRRSADDLAYLLYTSGSTGVPKGVMVEHRGVSNLRSFFEDRLGIGPNDRVLQFASLSFDASVWELTMALLTGAELHIAGADIIGDVPRFTRFMEDRRVTVSTLPPTYAVHVNPEQLGSLRLLVTAGSEAGKELLERWRERVTYINAYGPTETTVCATYWNGSLEPLPSSAPVPIGIPLPNTQAWIVNEDLEPLPANVAGELVIAGTGLARGYWNKPEMSEQRFVQLPSEGIRVYRTGDLARWTPDGRLVFLGRIDRQVKIRGYRIETEEVRLALLAHSGIRDAVVTVKPDALGEPALIAYYAADADGNNRRPDPESLRTTLAGRLPSYMIPSYFIELAAIPLTPNGKPDLKSLPDPADAAESEERTEGETPLGETETKLAEMWTSLLGLRRVRRDDDFFKLGGHSMKAVNMAAQIHETFGVNLPLEMMFRYATLAEMANRIERMSEEGTRIAPIEPAPARPGYRLSPAQTRVFTIESSRSASTLYVLPFAFWLNPAPPFDLLETAFNRLIERHEPLRTSFGWDKSEPVQIVHPFVPFGLRRIEGDPDQLDDLTGKFAEPFDLACPPLIRATAVEFRDGRLMLLLHLHHIIADGISLSILMNDLMSLLAGRELPPLTLQYKDYCEWLSTRDMSENREAYWSDRFLNYASTPDLPLDRPRTSVRSYEGDTLALHWDEATAASVRELAARCGTTLHLTMLAAYYVLLSKLTGTEESIIGSLHAGRDHPAASNMVGMFVHTLAHRIKVNPQLTFEAFTQEVKNRISEDYEHADYPFERLVRRLKLQPGSRNPLFDTMFVLQNLELPEPEIGQTRAIPHVLKETWSRFDLVLQAWENPNGLLLWITYSVALFRRDTVVKLAEEYRKLIEQLTRQPDIVLRELTMTSEYRPIAASRHSLDFQF